MCPRLSASWKRFSTSASIERLRALSRLGTVLLPVVAIEQTGVNRIPVAIAAILADRLGLAVASPVAQQCAGRAY
jgi:hypothetical protein